MNQKEINSQLLESLLRKAKGIIVQSIGENHYSELEKALKIVTQRNYNQYKTVKNKIGDTIIRIYNTRFDNMKDVIKILDEASALVKEIIKDDNG